MRSVELQPAEVIELLRDVALAERLSTAAGVALVVLDLRAADDTCHVAAERLESLATVLVARTSSSTSATWSSLADGCDVVTTDAVTTDAVTTDAVTTNAGSLDRRSVPESGLDALRERVFAAPLAATALALLLRNRRTGATTIEQELVAESAVYSLLQAGPEFVTWRSASPRRVRPDSDQPVLVRRTYASSGDRLEVTLNRPNVHNAFNVATRDALVEALQLAVVDNTISRIELRGAGPSFSSGGDLDEFGSFGDSATSHVVRLTRSPARLMAQLAERVHVHLHGSCMGAGIELPAFANNVIAAPDTRIALPEIRYGLIPGAGGTVSVTRRIGRHRTAYLALSATAIHAAIALNWGLIDGISPG